MAKNTLDDDIEEGLIMDNERSAPEIVRRYIRKYRQVFGANARRNIQRSNRWFMRRVTKDSRLSRERTFKQFKDSFRNRKPKEKALVGRLMMFRYDAKHKDTLPVWDASPLTFFFNTFIGDGEYGENGVQYLLGINVHYLAPASRLKLFVNLIKFNNDTALREKSKLKLSWSVLKAFAAQDEARHAVKMYRADYIRSEMIEINPRYWEIVMFLPIADWRKGTAKQAWKM